MNTQEIRLQLVPKIKKLAKKHGFEYVWEDYIENGQHISAMSDVVTFAYTCEGYYLTTISKKKWINYLTRYWIGIDNFFILDLFKLLDPYKKKYGTIKSTR